MDNISSLQLYLLALLLVASISTFFSLKLFRQYALKKGLIDIPNHRSSHTIPTPRGGGVIFVIVWIICSLPLLALLPHSFFFYNDLIVLFVGALAVAIVGYWDDLHSLTPLTRGGLHLAISIMAVFLLGGPNQLNIGNTSLLLGIGGFFLAIFFLIWSINLYNFMDGTDGLAAVEAIFIFGAGGFLLWIDNGVFFAIISWILVASVFGFLVWNWPKAKIFMGDSGSGFLGFIVMLTAILGEMRYGVPVFLWLVLYAVFLVDATLTLIRRILLGEKWYQAHRSHAYQRLHQAGWSHKKILIGLILVNTFLIFLTFWTNAHRHFMLFSVIIAFLFVSLLYGLIMLKKPIKHSISLKT